MGGQGRAEAGRGARGTQGLPEPAGSGEGGGGETESDRATDRWEQLDSWRLGDRHAERGRESQGKERERREREKQPRAPFLQTPSPLSEGSGWGIE